jgi:hypothetical protein
MPASPELHYRQLTARSYEIQAGPERAPVGIVRKQGSLPSCTRWYAVGDWDGARPTPGYQSRAAAACVVGQEYAARQSAPR